jgi:hypothetical protein
MPDLPDPTYAQASPANIGPVENVVLLLFRELIKCYVKESDELIEHAIKEKLTTPTHTPTEEEIFTHPDWNQLPGKVHARMRVGAGSVILKLVAANEGNLEDCVTEYSTCRRLNPTAAGHVTCCNQYVECINREAGLT